MGCANQHKYSCNTHEGIVTQTGLVHTRQSAEHMQYFSEMAVFVGTPEYFFILSWGTSNASAIC